MSDLYFASVIAFVAALAFLIYRDRKNWKFSFVSMRRFREGEELFKKIAFRSQKFWKVMEIISVLVCVYLLIDGTRMLLLGTKLILEGKLKGPTGGIVVPYPFPKFKVGYGYVLIPFWFFMALFPLVTIPHELLHGVFMKLNKIKIKTSGFFFILFLPGGAFVEQDQKSFKRAKTHAKVKVACAGSFANFLMFLFFLGLIKLIWPVPPIYLNGLNVTNVSFGSPVYKAGISVGMVVRSINNLSFVGPASNLTLNIDFKPGETVIIRTENQTFMVIAGKNPKNETKGYLGFVVSPLQRMEPVYRDFIWLLIFEYWVAIMNIMPIYPLDGGIVLKSIVENRVKNWKLIVYPISFIFSSLILFLVVGPALLSLNWFG